MRFFRIPAFTGIEVHRDDADRGSLRVVEGCVPHGPGGLRSGPVWETLATVSMVSTDDQNHLSAMDDGKGNSIMFASRKNEVHDIKIVSTENTDLNSLGTEYEVVTGSPYINDEAMLSPVGNRLYSFGDGTAEAVMSGKGPIYRADSGVAGDDFPGVFPDLILYRQEWSRFPNCQFFVQGPKKTIFAAGNPQDPLVVYISEPAGMTQPIRDSPYSTEDNSQDPGLTNDNVQHPYLGGGLSGHNEGLSTVRILGSNATRISALSTRGDKIVVHTDKGCHILYAPTGDQASTGYRTEQVAATNTSAAVNAQTVAGDGGTQPFWLGFDGQIYKDEAAVRGAEDFKSFSDPQQASWKAKGKWEVEHPANLENSFATYDPQSGMYWVFIESTEQPLNVRRPTFAPKGLIAVTLPVNGPTELSGIVRPVNGPTGLSGIVRPVNGPTELSGIVRPVNGPTELSAIQPPPSAGPSDLSALTAPTSGPTSLSAIQPPPSNGPTSLNAEKVVNLEWSGVLTNGWTHTTGLREDYAGLPVITSMTTLIRDKLVDASVLRTSNPYTISGTDASHFTFSNTSSSANLNLIGPLDYETKNDYSIVITVHATNGDTLFMNFNLDVVDVAEAPASGPTGLNAANAITAPSSGPTGLNASQASTAITCSNLSDLTTGGVHSIYLTQTIQSVVGNADNFGWQSFQNVSTPTTESEMDNTGGSGSTCFQAMTAYFPNGGISKWQRNNGVCDIYQHWAKANYAGLRNVDQYITQNDWALGTGVPSWSFIQVVPGGSTYTWYIAGNTNGNYKVIRTIGTTISGPDQWLAGGFDKVSSTQCEPGGVFQQANNTSDHTYTIKAYVAAHPRNNSFQSDGVFGGSGYAWDGTSFQLSF